MSSLLYIDWNASPEIFSIGPLTLRWYGLLFASGFVAGLYMVRQMFEREHVPEKWLDSAFIYIVIGAVVGARLGHVFFYEWGYYQAHPGDILKVWKGGLASHGGAIGIFTALWLYSKVVTQKPLLWIFDKVAVPVPLAGFFIRMGNLMNSEIIGKETDISWAFVFHKVDEVPRHAVQLYEALAYLVIFFIIYPIFWKTDKRNKPGYVFGLLLVLVFGVRFVLEYFKENLGGLQNTFNSALTTGQLLSIPLVLFGLYLMFRKKK